MKIDHFVVNIDEVYQKDKKNISNIRDNIPYEPKWGKGTKGFKVSNLWIGNEYLEMVNVLKKDGGGWVPEWTTKFNQGHRGMICLMLDVPNIDFVFQNLKLKGIEVTEPKWLEFKWFFNLLTRRMPWRNTYVSFFENVLFQIGFQEMKDDKSREFMNQYMVPNSRENGINGIYQVAIKGEYSDKDFNVILAVFGDKAHKENNSIVKVQLNETQSIEFIKGREYQIDLFTNVNTNKSILIENLTIHC